MEIGNLWFHPLNYCIRKLYPGLNSLYFILNYLYIFELKAPKRLLRFLLDDKLELDYSR